MKTSLSAVEVVDVPPQPALVVRAECSRAELGQILASILPRVFRFALENGCTPAGPPFTSYLETNGERLAIEAGLPLTARAEGAGDILARDLPEGRAATLIHAGAYDGLPEAHRALAAWAAGSGATAHAPLWEVYLTDPSTEADPEKWKTKVLMPIA